MDFHLLWLPIAKKAFAKKESNKSLFRIRSSLLTESYLVSVNTVTEIFQFTMFCCK